MRAGLVLIAGLSLVAPSMPMVTSISQSSEEVNDLVNVLVGKGFEIRFELPPTKGVYGQFDRKTRTLWISPIAFELGIARHTFLHEATHAAQSCPSGVLTPIGWELPLEAVVRNEIAGITYMHYSSVDQVLEREAFALQGQPNAVNLLIKALEQRCINSTP